MMKGERDANKRIDMFNQLERTRHDLELIVAKQRGGRTGTANLKCDLAFNQITDIEDRPRDYDEELPL
jgi:replicative DNA helicase